MDYIGNMMMYPVVSFERIILHNAFEGKVNLSDPDDQCQSPTNALISNILSMGTRAACIVSSSISICGWPYCMHRYSF